MGALRLRYLLAAVTLSALPASAVACNALTGAGSLEETSCASDCDAHRDGAPDAATDVTPDAAAEDRDARNLDSRPPEGGRKDAGDAAPRDVVEEPEGSPPPPITFIQTNSDSTGIALTESVAFAGDVAAGDLLIVGVDFDQPSGATLTTVTDTLGDTFAVAVGPYDGQGIREYITYAIAKASGADTVTATLGSTTNSYFEVRLHEYSGIAAVSSFDVGASGNGTSNAMNGMVTSPITTAANNELIFEIGICGTCMAGMGFNQRSNFADDFTADEIATKAGVYQGYGTETAGMGWAMSIAAFRGL